VLESPQEDWMVSGMILAIWQHRRRIDQLLARLDAPGRSAVDAAVTALIDGSLDAGTLVARMSDGARPGEGRVRQLVELLAPDPPGNRGER
jgi:hypothetical protein